MHKKGIVPCKALSGQHKHYVPRLQDDKGSGGAGPNGHLCAALRATLRAINGQAILPFPPWVGALAPGAPCR